MYDLHELQKQELELLQKWKYLNMEIVKVVNAYPDILNIDKDSLYKLGKERESVRLELYHIQSVMRNYPEDDVDSIALCIGDALYKDMCKQK